MTTQVSAQFTVESGQKVTADLLQAAPKIDAIWNHDDDQGIGVMAAINQANRDEFFMVGGAGSRNAMDAIKADNTRAQGDGDLPAEHVGVGDQAGPAIAHGKGMSDLVENEVPASITLARDRHQGQRRQVPAPALRVLIRRSLEPGRSPARRTGAAEHPSIKGSDNAKPDLGVGMVGYAFMGAAHSQAWRTAAHFFDLPLTVDMAALGGRTADAARAAAERLGWRVVETDWRALDRPGGRRPRRRLHARRHPRGDRRRRARGRQARALREAARQHRRGGRGHGGGGRPGGRARRAVHGRVQLPAGAGARARPALVARRPARHHPPRAGAVPAGLDRGPAVPAGRGGCSGRSPGPARSATSARTSWTPPSS